MPLAGSWPRGFALTRFNQDHDHDDDFAIADADENDDVADADAADDDDAGNAQADDNAEC